jgi:hypothetical protein
MDCKELLLKFIDSSYYDPEEIDSIFLQSSLTMFLSEGQGYGLKDCEQLLDECIEWLDQNIG